MDKSKKSGKNKLKCRCCALPSDNFMQIDSIIKVSEGLEKTYKDFIYEITNQKVIKNLHFFHVCYNKY